MLLRTTTAKKNKNPFANMSKTKTFLTMCLQFPISTLFLLFLIVTSLIAVAIGAQWGVCVCVCIAAVGVVVAVAVATEYR